MKEDDSYLPERNRKKEYRANSINLVVLGTAR